MIEGEKKGIGIRWGWLILILILFFIIFKIDIKEKINSPILNKNIEYVSNFFMGLWDNHIKEKFDNTIDNISKKLINSSIESAQDVVNKKLEDLKKE